MTQERMLKPAQYRIHVRRIKPGILRATSSASTFPPHRNPTHHEVDLCRIVGFKDPVHWDLPERIQLELTPADISLEAVVGDPLIERVWPVGVRASGVRRSGGSHRGIVREACCVQLRQRVAVVSEERGAEAGDGGEGDSSEAVESLEVAEDLGRVGRSGVGLFVPCVSEQDDEEGAEGRTIV